MASPLGIFVTTVATAVTLKAAGSSVPALDLLHMGAKILVEIDDEMEKAAVESVMDANRNLDGSPPNIVFLSYDKGYRTKKDLERYIERQGGTAWFQSGSNRRMEAFWHHSSTFKPKEAKGCYLGHIVHGSKDGL